MTTTWTWRAAATVALLAALVAAGLFALRPAAADPGDEVALPDLVADPPEAPAIAVDASGGGGARLLLRFDGYIHNAGPGELMVIGHRNPAEEVLQVRQVFSPLGQSSYRVPSGQWARHVALPRARIVYDTGDGHDHFHLDRISRYSLWNAGRTALTAPSMKIGFCLTDSRRVETNGPAQRHWDADRIAPCGQGDPDDTFVEEGVSAGWRDWYRAGIAYQWVDISNVLPGSYWIRADIDPDQYIVEANETNPPAYMDEPTIVPGFNAIPGAAQTDADRPVDVTLTAQRWSGSILGGQPGATRPEFAIVDDPDHGTLGPIAGDGTVRYTPDPGYHGPDRFTFSARDHTSQFPISPATATVTLQVDEVVEPSVTIDDVPTRLVAGATHQFGATVVGPDQTVDWSATAGTIDGTGLYTAPAVPPASGTVTVTARTDDAQDAVTFAIDAARPPVVTIHGAPGSMVAGESAELSATVEGDAPGVTWSATAGTITPDGLFTAPGEPPAGGTVTVAATSAGGANDQRVIEIRARPAPPRPVVAISGAPERLVAGTTVQLTATVIDDLPSVRWSVSAGTITPDGAYTAPSEPPAGGSVQVTASSGRASDTRTIAIEPRPPVIPRPLPEPGDHHHHQHGDGGLRPRAARPLSAIAAARLGRQLVMTVTPSKSGRLRVTAYVGRRKLGACVARVRSRRTFTCRVKLGARVSARARIRIVAGLRVGRSLSRVERRAAPVANGHAH